MKLLKRTAIGLGLLALLAWIAVAGLVMFWDDAGPLGELGPRSEGIWIFPGGYSDHFSSVSWEGDAEEPPPDAWRRSAWLQRGPLDREAATFPLSLRLEIRGESRPVASVDLMVSSEAGSSFGAGEGPWLSVCQSAVHEADGAWIATIAKADAPAAACRYRVAIAYLDGEDAGSFAKTMPTAPTALGRLHDRVAWLPLFRWLPDLR